MQESESVAELRTLIVSALGLTLSAWDIAFNLGVHGTIFYNKLQTLWVAATVVLLCVFLAGKAVHGVSRIGMLALFSPTVWLILNVFASQFSLTWLNEILLLSGLIIYAVSIPYILYVLFELAQSDFFRLTPYHRDRLIGIVLFITVLGYLMGVFNQYFVSCEQFEIAGDQPPAECIKQDNR